MHFHLTKGLIFRKENYNADFEDIFVPLSKIALELEINFLRNLQKVRLTCSSGLIFHKGTASECLNTLSGYVPIELR